MPVMSATFPVIRKCRLRCGYTRARRGQKIICKTRDSISKRMALHPVILCGGSGTRLWPLSRAMLPKQFLPLAGERTMIQDTALRLAGLPDAAAPAIVSHFEQRFLAAEQLREVGVSSSLHLLEPEARNTAPAIAAAALCIAKADPEGLMLVLPSD